VLDHPSEFGVSCRVTGILNVNRDRHTNSLLPYPV
jgi:hypothetical protein